MARRSGVNARRAVSSAGGTRRRALDRADDGALRLEGLVRRLLRRWRARRDRDPIIPSPAQVRALAPRFRRPLPWRADPPGGIAADLEALLTLSRHNDSGRFWGYVAPPGLVAGTLADWLASGINQNLTAFRSAPGAALVEMQVVEWIREMVGLPRSAGGLLTSGGSVANLAGLAAARDAAVPYDLARRGLRGEPGRPLVLYASEEVHHAVIKAAAILGIGRDFVRLVPVDRRLRLDVAALRDAVRRDRRARLQPFAVAASAGTVTTGAVDPLRDVWRLCRRERLWMHVDACYGGFAILAPSARPILRALSLADSIALDPHKWLFQPFSLAVLLARDRDRLRASCATEPDYLRKNLESETDRLDFYQHSLEGSRPFRGLKLDLTLQSLGRNGLGALVDRTMDVARHLERRVLADARFETCGAPVDCATVVLRYLPEWARGAARSRRSAGEGTGLRRRVPADRRRLDRLQRRIQHEVERRGEAWFPAIVLDGEVWLRIGVFNYRTTERDADRLLRAILRAAGE